MKYYLTLLFIAITCCLSAQEKYISNNGNIKFYSKTPIENIEATNNQVQCLLNKTNGIIAFKVLIKNFNFKEYAMQEHFNSDFLHSSKYPNATFEGVINNNESIDYSKNGTYAIKVSGKLTIHNITKEVSQMGTLSVKDGKIRLQSNFNILLKDFGISVPSIYVKKLATTIQVTVDSILEPYIR
jgi:flagellar basal body P-ring protein FlgI